MNTRWIILIGLMGLILAGAGILYSKKWASSHGRKDIDKTLSAIEKYKIMQSDAAFDFEFLSLNLDKKQFADMSSANLDSTGKGSTGKTLDSDNGETNDKNSALPKIRLSDFKGKVILLNFWASWCEPCISEFPDMLSLKKQRPDIEIIAVNRDQNLNDAINFIKTFPESIGLITYYWDPKGEITDLYGTEVLPESYLIGKDFKVLRKIIGIEDWDNPNVLRFIDSL